MIARNSDNNEMTQPSSSKEQLASKASTKSANSKTWYSVPEPIRRVFDRFPLVTYKENLLPQRARRRLDRHTLFVFANSLDTSGTGLSCNPTCLKWQIYLKFNDIEFAVVASNNHASPSGSLPFFLPAVSASQSVSTPLTTAKIPRWTSQQIMQEEDVLSIQHQAYITLVDQSIRHAWLYHLYLIETNFSSVAHPLYVSTVSSNRLVQAVTASQLRSAAQTELLKSMHIIDSSDIYDAATKAFNALSILLGSEDYFSKEERPNLFDASVFAYTHLLLDESLPWGDQSLPDILRDHPRLLHHRQQILNTYVKI